ncbi:MAG: hypothetical protein KKG76_09620 [Euryarchaeota archaeon]|nr:hypothetical protein [Euryarchaeota archaeon]
MRSNKSASINAETLRVLDSAHTNAPQGIGGLSLTPNCIETASPVPIINPAS